MMKILQIIFKNSCIAFVCAIFFILPGTTFGATDSVAFDGQTYTFTTNKDTYTPSETIALGRTVTNGGGGTTYYGYWFFSPDPFDYYGITSFPNPDTQNVGFIAPNTNGSYFLIVQLERFGCSVSCPLASVELPFTVTSAPAIGTVVASSTNSLATWTISGPPITDLEGSGTYQEYPSQPIGSYAITWDPIPGYKTPEIDNEKTLASGETIVFNGIYIPTQIDLTAGSTYPVNVITDAPTLFYSVITNGGSDATGASFPNFFQVATSTGGVGIIANLAPKTMPALGAGASAVASSTPYTFTTGGIYYVRSCADKTASAGGGVITETNEDNNCGAWTSINVIETSLLPEVINATSTNITATTARLGAEVTSFGAYSGTLVEPVLEYTATAGMNASAVSPDGRHFYVVEYGTPGKIHLYNRDDSGEISPVESYDTMNSSLEIKYPITISPDGKNIYVASLTTTTKFITKYDRNISDGKLSNKVDYTTASIAHKIILSPEGSHLYTSMPTGVLKLRTRDLVSGSLSNETNTIPISGMAAQALDIVFSSDGKSLYTSNFEDVNPDKVARFIRNPITGVISIRTDAPYLNSIRPESYDVIISPDNRYVYASYDKDHDDSDTSITIARFSRNIINGSLPDAGRANYSIGLYSHSRKISPDGNSIYTFLSTTSSGEINLFRINIDDGSINTSSLDNHAVVAGGGVQISPDGKSIYYHARAPANKIYLYKRTPPSISARGVCYGTMETPSLINGATCVASAPATLGAYAVNVTGLQQGTKYYYHGYATNSHGTVYTSPTGSFTTAINGVCGSTNNIPTLTAPTTNLCAFGTPTEVTGVNTPSWIWNCEAIDNDGVGTDAYCNAYNLNYIPGACGSAHNTPTPTAPTTNLCADGSSSTPINDGTTWSWTCSGSGGGGNASCSAQSAIKIKYRMF